MTSYCPFHLLAACYQGASLSVRGIRNDGCAGWRGDASAAAGSGICTQREPHRKPHSLQLLRQLGNPFPVRGLAQQNGSVVE
jgi:hypothetical protein